MLRRIILYLTRRVNNKYQKNKIPVNTNLHAEHGHSHGDDTAPHTHGKNKTNSAKNVNPDGL